MKKRNLAVWVFALANIVVALTGLFVSWVSENVLLRVLEGKKDAIPLLTTFYFGHRVLIFAVFAFLLPLAALVRKLRNPATSEGALLFGAVTVLLIALQMLLAAVAIGTPLYVPRLVPFGV